MWQRGRALVWLSGLCLALCTNVSGQPVDAPTLYQQAVGQTVYFNAWGGDPAINRYIEWAAQRVQDEYGVTLRHVKVTDIAEAVLRIRAERAAGRDSDGSIDLLWINGENFAALKTAGLLHGPWTATLPGTEHIDWRNPTMGVDGNLATEGYELPWGTSALTFFFATERVVQPPTTPAVLLQWIEAHPGRFSYPQPPVFVGSAFLKQLLALLAAQPARLQQPVGDDFDAVTQPLWEWLDRAHPFMWRRGHLFPRSGPAQRELLAVGELDWMLSYNPSEASRAISQGELPASIGALQMQHGALANSHFLAIAYNSSATAGAKVVAAFLLSPLAQARKADERYWGDTTVLDLETLSVDERAAFATGTRGVATPSPGGRKLAEPHPDWTQALEHAWLARYTR